MAESLKSRWKELLWLMAGVVLVAVALPLDVRVDSALDVTGEPRLHALAWWCSKAGEGGVIGAVGIFFSAAFFLLKRPRIAADIFFITLTSSLTGLSAAILKLVFGRTRPLDHEVPQGFYGLWHEGHWIAGKFLYGSFPSGHAASAAGLAAAAWLVHRGWGTVAALYAVAVMWSRIALQYHHLSDVLASVVLSIPLAMLLKQVLARSVEFQFNNLSRAVRGE